MRVYAFGPAVVESECRFVLGPHAFGTVFSFDSLREYMFVRNAHWDGRYSFMCTCLAFNKIQTLSTSFNTGTIRLHHTLSTPPPGLEDGGDAFCNHGQSLRRSPWDQVVVGIGCAFTCGFGRSTTGSLCCICWWWRSSPLMCDSVSAGLGARYTPLPPCGGGDGLGSAAGERMRSVSALEPPASMTAGKQQVAD